MRTCCVCGRLETGPAPKRIECRPYGLGGADICFECAFTPERAESTKQAYGALLDAASSASPIAAAVLTDQGPDPFTVRTPAR